jgi:hypothetical protein
MHNGALGKVCVEIHDARSSFKHTCATPTTAVRQDLNDPPASTSRLTTALELPQLCIGLRRLLLSQCPVLIAFVISLALGLTWEKP